LAIKIGHSPKDENGKIAGGRAGDQTGKEVCIRSWYNGSWDFVARFKDKAKAEKAAKACEDACNNPNVGYDQGGRNSLRTEAKKVDYQLGKITTPCESDCSSFMGVCVEAAGIRLPEGNGPTTRTLRRTLEATGEFEILTAEKYLTSDKYLQRSDILCNEGIHTVMALEDGSMAGRDAVPELNTATMYYNVRLPLLVRGSSGPSVEALQTLLKGRGYNLGSFGPNRDGVDGDFGDATENALEAFQEDVNIKPDGKCGGQSWLALITM
jgi:hypothetical protein